MIKVTPKSTTSMFYLQNVKIYIEIYIGALLRLFTSLIKTVAKYNKLERVEYISKTGGDNRGQWGYFCSRDVYPLLKLLEKYHITSLCDLGSGVGIFLRALIDFTWIDLKVKGFEIEPLFVEIAKLYFGIDTYQKDILTLVEDDLLEFDSLYVYEPFDDEEQRELFFDNLLEVMKKDQFLFYKSRSDYYLSLTADKRIQLVEDTVDFHVFQKR